MIETLAVLTFVAAAALLLWWPRARQRRQRRQPAERAARPISHGTPRAAPGLAASESEAATRLRREMVERVQAVRQARERSGAASLPPTRTADDAPTGFAETTLLEDPPR
jgi:hypothetical protein